MGPGHLVWWFHVSSSHTHPGFFWHVLNHQETNLGLSENVLEKPEMRMVRDQFSSWKLPSGGWFMAGRDAETVQFLNIWVGFYLFPCFLSSCHNHVRIVVSYPYHMIYTYNLYIYILYPHATSLDSLSPVCLAGRKTGLEIRGSQSMFPSHLREQRNNREIGIYLAIIGLWRRSGMGMDGNGWDDMGLTRKWFIYAWFKSI